ncbi:MAG: hypothetical protein A2293_05355 [Elusimicrobia bacterium RIFOXYB2_FULL_49_7]|nr:MAG: hypothetical protein A2293_05355 [Elusimicrobia bacterium RIFOXYB2_FULL_49_7]
MGGQGVLRGSEICAMAALNSGLAVKKSEVKGMSQRGGSVDSHVRFGNVVHSPLIPAHGADFYVPFNEEEGRRWRHFFNPKGKDLTPLLATAAATVPDKKFINTFMLGALSTYLPFTNDAWFTALDAGFKKAQEENRQVFRAGQQKGSKR